MRPSSYPKVATLALFTVVVEDYRMPIGSSFANKLITGGCQTRLADRNTSSNSRGAVFLFVDYHYGFDPEGSLAFKT